MSLFRGKYKNESSRKPGFDYTSPGSYFITINARWRICWFGEVVAGVMQLSDIGDIVAEEWLKTAAIRRTVTLDKWVIMPDHFHGILTLHASESDALSGRIPFANLNADVRVNGGIEMDDGGEMNDGTGTTRRVVPEIKITDDLSNQKRSSTLQPNSVGSIIGQFKSVCTKRIRDLGYDDFEWQGRFHDRIIRNAAHLNRIRNYIIMNPVKWDR